MNSMTRRPSRALSATARPPGTAVTVAGSCRPRMSAACATMSWRMSAAGRILREHARDLAGGVHQQVFAPGLAHRVDQVLDEQALEPHRQGLDAGGFPGFDQRVRDVAHRLAAVEPRDLRVFVAGVEDALLLHRRAGWPLPKRGRPCRTRRRSRPARGPPRGRGHRRYRRPR